MDLSRRGFLKGSAAATAGLVTAPLATEMPSGQKHEAVGHSIAAIFDTLPGEKALKIVAPSRSGKSVLA
jgi:secreted PhoX family phosphatase